MKTSRDPSRRRSLFVAAGLAALAVIYLMCFFLPRMRAIADMRAEIEAKQTFILEAHKGRALAEQARTELTAAQEYVAQHQGQLLKPDELPGLYGKISHLAKQHDVVTSRFEPQPAQPYESLHRVAIGLGVQGSFASIHNWLHDLEQLPARIWMEDLKLRGPREAGKPVECDLTLVVFIDIPEKSN